MAGQSRTPWWWCAIKNLQEDLKKSTETLAVFKNSLYTSDLERDRTLFHEQYCFECKGFCREKSCLINQIRVLTRELDQSLFAINDVLVQKCVPHVNQEHV